MGGIAVDPTVVAFPQGPAAPPHLSPAEAETWKAVLASRKPGFFGPEIFHLIEAYCATALACARIGARLRVEEGINDSLLEIYDRMTRSLSDLAQALCLLPGQPRES
jgi:hypothetical protein